MKRAYILLTMLALLFCVSTPAIGDDEVIVDTVSNVRLVYWGDSDTRPNETFITLDSGSLYRFPSNESIGIGQGFKVEIRVSPSAPETVDGSITACAMRVLAIPLLVNEKETLYPVDGEIWIAQVQEDMVQSCESAI